MPVNAKNQSRKEQATKTSAKPTTAINPMAQMNAAMTEDERIAAMFSAQGEQWNAQQEEMAK